MWAPDRSMVGDFAAFLGDEVGLPRRFLPHSKLTTLFWLMNSTLQAEAGPDDDARVPSWAVFYRVWSSSWARFLKFRKSSQHAECKICFGCREQMHKKGLALHDRIDFARQWRTHLRMAYHDRLIYWWCRYASRRSMDVLTVIIDSMDKAKFAWPQFPWGRADKTLERFRRPRLIVTGAFAHGPSERIERGLWTNAPFFRVPELGWAAASRHSPRSCAQGYGTFLYVSEDTLSHGSSAFCDVLARVLETVWSQCEAKGLAFPRHLVVQSDNTTAQAKNSYVAMFLAYLVGRYKFATANLFFLPVGHTHEDIGGQALARTATVPVFPKFAPPIGGPMW